MWKFQQEFFSFNNFLGTGFSGSMLKYRPDLVTFIILILTMTKIRGRPFCFKFELRTGLNVMNRRVCQIGISAML